MLRVGGWDGTAGKRSRSCQRAHARRGQENATEAGVAWQGQGMLVIWRGGQHGGGLWTFLLAGEAGQVAEATHPRRANPRPVPVVYLRGGLLSWLPRATAAALQLGLSGKPAELDQSIGVSELVVSEALPEFRSS